MKILINTPKINIPAGVANHYLGLKPYFSHNVIYNQYFTRFNLRKIFKLKILYIPVFPIVFIMNHLKFIFLILKLNRPTVLLNPSFGKTAMKRDAQFLKIAKSLGCKVAVFIHGWDKNYLDKVLKKEEYFSNKWYNADAFFVLATEFKEYLKKLNIKAPIHLTTTKVNDQLIDGVPEKSITVIKSILFLARIEKNKGIFISIDAFQILIKKHPELQFQIVGRGNALNEAKEYVKSKSIPNIMFTGPLSGEELTKEFRNAELYILPTTHGEGMPTSVLEAMAFGLPVITRPVGGLVDFFENDKMGYMIESLNAEEYAEKIEILITNVEKARQISSNNAKYAREHFMASTVAKHLEDKLSEL